MVSLLEKITIIIDLEKYTHVFYLWFSGILVTQLIFFVIFSSRFPKVISLIGLLHHIFVSLYSFIFFFFVFFMDTTTSSKYAIYPLAWSLSYLFIDILSIIGKPDYTLLTKISLLFHHIFMLILGFYAINNIASFCIFGVEILESSSVFFNFYNFVEYEQHPKLKFFLFTCFVIFFFLTRFILYPFLIGHCFDNFTPFIFVIGMFFQILMVLWLFIIIKKYKNMLNMLFDKENYDPTTNFDLMKVKAENIKKDTSCCYDSDKLGENFKYCVMKLFSCNCCDCEIEEYDEDENTEEIELEIIRKKQERKKRRQERKKRLEEENSY